MTVPEARLNGWRPPSKVIYGQLESHIRGLISDGYLNSLRYETAERKWALFLAEPENIIFVAEERGRVIGFAAGMPVRKDSGMRRAFALYVENAAKGCGIGGTLLSVLARYFSEKNMKSLICMGHGSQ